MSLLLYNFIINISNVNPFYIISKKQFALFVLNFYYFLQIKRIYFYKLIYYNFYNIKIEINIISKIYLKIFLKFKKKKRIQENSKKILKFIFCFKIAICESSFG